MRQIRLQHSPNQERQTAKRRIKLLLITSRKMLYLIKAYGWWNQDRKISNHSIRLKFHFSAFCGSFWMLWCDQKKNIHLFYVNVLFLRYAAAYERMCVCSSPEHRAARFWFVQYERWTNSQSNHLKLCILFDAMNNFLIAISDVIRSFVRPPVTFGLRAWLALWLRVSFSRYNSHCFETNNGLNQIHATVFHRMLI